VVDPNRRVQLGKTGPSVFPIALGCMSMGRGSPYGDGAEAESIATVHAAIDRGVSLLDTGDFYGMGSSEMLVGQVIKDRRDKVQLSVKFGGMRGPDGSWFGYDARPAAVKNFAAYSLKRLGVDVIDVYRPARLDPLVPIEDTIGAIADLIEAGFVRHIGLSEVGVETIRRASKVHPIVDLQIEYSIITRGPEDAIFPVLTQLGMSATLYGVLSRGLLTGSKVGGKGDFRGLLPRFSGDAGVRNASTVARFQAFAAERGMTPAQLSAAWVLAKQPAFVPVVGARTSKQLHDVADALEHPLSAADVLALEAVVPKDAIEGARYPTEHLKHLDSEH
jgi:aryl-alcohol dehydrogenase-like predicted oxidoreductase